jgi:glycerophosphoryl diester phosphodiesterase
MSDLDFLSPLRKTSDAIRIHGHRAARGVLPENTMVGCRNTLDIGLKILELDILVTADGIPVVTHYPRLMAAATRDQNGRWLRYDSHLIYMMSFDTLQEFDVGGLRANTSYGNKYPDQAFLTGVRVPSLAQVAGLIKEPEFEDVWLNLEIKSSPEAPENTPPLPELVSTVLRVLTDQKISDRVFIQSFDWRVLSELQRQMPDMPRSYLSYIQRKNPTVTVNIYEGSVWMDGVSLAPHAGALPQAIASLGGQIWSPYFQDINTTELDEAHRLGLIVNAWTVNEPSEIHRMIDLGVDGIITDYPARVQRCLKAYELSW